MSVIICSHQQPVLTQICVTAPAGRHEAIAGIQVSDLSALQQLEIAAFMVTQFETFALNLQKRG